MSDHMPDEVWLDWHWELPDVVAHVFDRIDGSTRYIRADLYEQAEAERDRLRAALESIRDWPEDWQRDGWAIAQEFQGIAEEALDHD